jgi:hypothetical protein
MNFWTYLTLATVMGCSIPLFSLWQRGRSEKAPPRGEVEAMYREVEKLRERVQVLESIVTDKSYEVRREFAALEAQSANGGSGTSVSR